jgi:hypothetical protein
MRSTGETCATRYEFHTGCDGSRLTKRVNKDPVAAIVMGVDEDFREPSSSEKGMRKYLMAFDLSRGRSRA